MAKRVLITGASGLVGRRLTELLQQKGHDVIWLGRDSASTYVWDVNRGTIDKRSLESVESIIHLAGAGIADKRWTAERKKEILDSRIQSTHLLFKALKEGGHRVESFVSASAIGYYGPGDSNQLFTEDSPAGADFLAHVVKKWEESSQGIVSLGIRVVRLRTGIVLSGNGGVLKSMAAPIRFGFGAPLGSGEQYLSWIHIDDLCKCYIAAMEDPSMQGSYNAVGIQPVTNREMTQAIARVLLKPLWLPSVPSFALRLALGEMADLVLTGAKVSPERILKTGIELKFKELDAALEDQLTV